MPEEQEDTTSESPAARPTAREAEVAAAIKIQSKARGRLARKQSRNLQLEAAKRRLEAQRELEASNLRCLVPGAHLEWTQLEHSAAIKMQAATRGFIIRWNAIVKLRRRIAAQIYLARWYREILATYLQARIRIQSLVRGYLGRIYAVRWAHELKAIKLLQTRYRMRLDWKRTQFMRRRRYQLLSIQSTMRGFMVRNARAKLIMLGHRLLAEAATVVLRWARGAQGRKDMERLRMACLAAEQARLAREKEIIDEAVQLAEVREKFYLDTPEGQYEKQQEYSRLYKMEEKKRKEFKRMEEAGLKEEVERAKVLEVFQSFDRDGSGGIDVDELRLLLDELCVPMSPNELDFLMQSLDQDDSGTVDFDEFYEW